MRIDQNPERSVGRIYLDLDGSIRLLISPGKTQLQALDNSTIKQRGNSLLLGLRSNGSNLEILKTGSIVPAKYMGTESSWGQVKEGFDADFVLVENNPLLDLKTLQRPVGVVIRGQWIGREELQSQLDRIEKNHLRN